MCLATDVLHAGRPYDMGYAQGVLMKDRVQGMMNSAWNFFELQVVGHSDCIYSVQSISGLLYIYMCSVLCGVPIYVLCTVQCFNICALYCAVFHYMCSVSFGVPTTINTTAFSGGSNKWYGSLLSCMVSQGCCKFGVSCLVSGKLHY